MPNMALANHSADTKLDAPYSIAEVGETCLQCFGLHDPQNHLSSSTCLAEIGMPILVLASIQGSGLAERSLLLQTIRWTAHKILCASLAASPRTGRVSS
jgi:hypothetical protein